MGIVFLCLFIISIYSISKYEEFKEFKFKTNKEFISINENLKKREENINKKEKDIERILNDHTQNASWLVQRFIDYKEITDNDLSEYLKNKSHPAIKASEIIKQVNAEKRKYLYEAKALKYQLDYLTHIFPVIEETMQIDAIELETLVSEINSSETQKEEYEYLKKWLTPEEYSKLSSDEKYQLALNRYLNKKNKTPWEIGISYERYIGYIYETKGYSVIYNGALKGLNDLGKDVIAENDKELLIIQCKYWSKEKVIHEKHIFQLYGTMFLNQLELSKKNIKKKVTGIFVTTTTLSNTAKLVAKELGIVVKENENFIKDYPCIKCNINRTTNQKIYHLPFDQQYDRIKITPSKGECYVKTVKEAEQLGFRRACKYFYK